MVAMFTMLFFVLLFTTLVIYEKYNNFENEINSLRQAYIDKQKKSVNFDIDRVLNYIQYEYEHKKLITDDEFKLRIVDTIEHLYGREDGTGYIFIYDINGTKISNPIWSEDREKNLYNIQDIHGVEILKELIQIAQTSDERFLEYTWKKPTTGELSLKLSHAKTFLPFKWIVGTGFYLDEVEKLIQVQRLSLKKRLIRYVMEILSLTVILFGIGLIGMVIINNIISREIDIFSDFFKQASKRYTTIDEEKIYLLRFKKMVHYVNHMVTEIHQRKDKLKELNLSLEKKVEQKTEDLNRLLKKQDSFIKHAIHEINTPLAVIMTHLDIYKMKFGENRYLSKIEAGTKIIANIYDDLSYMVKKERFNYEKESLNFSLFLKSRIDFFEEIALGNRHKILINIEEDIFIDFNKIELQRIIDNNLSNAIKYAKKESDIVVELKRVSKYILLKFKTNSLKIEDTNRIFEAFHQVEVQQSGFGLGLEIVASICQKNSIEVEVKSDDEITVFSYLF
jgi:signal transduction histidine kinase